MRKYEVEACVDGRQFAFYTIEANSKQEAIKEGATRILSELDGLLSVSAKEIK